MNQITNLTITQMIFAYLLLVIIFIIFKIRGIKKEKEILLSSLRMTVQLILAGYFLIFVFDNASPYFTITIVATMILFAIYTIFKKFSKKLNLQLKIVVALSLLVSTIFSLFYFLIIIIQVNPWYNPQYFIPLGGMLIGNSMTGMALGLKNMLENMKTQRLSIEESLLLGATPKDATRDIVNSSFESAIMPTINSMLGMGIIFLPGMMTGQILSGTSPNLAILYQIVIMLGILTSVTVAVFFMLHFGNKTFFNKDEQLI
jgi:putative ABC transport system permease protein